MRIVATAGSVIMAAFLLGGCPLHDKQTGPDPSAGSVEVPDAQAGASVVPAADDGPDSSPADAAVAGQAPADQTPVEDATGDGDSEQQTVPEPLVIPQGIYVGDVTLVEDAQLSGIYAAYPKMFHFPTHRQTLFENCGITIDDDGLPSLESPTNPFVEDIAYTFLGFERTTDGVITHWSVQVDYSFGDVGDLSLLGTETDTYRLTDTGSLQIEFVLEAQQTDVKYHATLSGELVM